MPIPPRCSCGICRRWSRSAPRRPAPPSSRYRSTCWPRWSSSRKACPGRSSRSSGRRPGPRVADPYGLRRVVRPKGVLPQQAEVIDPRLPLGPDELSIDVEHLNVDAASFRQLSQECGGDPSRIAARGRAVLFATGLWAPMPDDLPEALALAVLDVCGAPAWVARLTQRGQRVLVLGAGKSGSLACAQARKNGAHVTELDFRP